MVACLGCWAAVLDMYVTLAPPAPSEDTELGDVKGRVRGGFESSPPTGGSDRCTMCATMTVITITEEAVVGHPK